MVNFIGIGAQKSGTSWVYTCLYEHPEVCIPVKEIHFFSRPRFTKGKEWYEEQFRNCDLQKKTGEFSTSYLYSPEAPERMVDMYPNVKLIALLRNPRDRAYSQYMNAIKGGEISKEMTFATYTTQEPSCIEQGKYAAQLERYFKVFPREHLLVLVYEDIEKDPLAFIQQIYAHIGVDSSFAPPSLYAHINVARIPKTIKTERIMHHIAEWLRRRGFDRLVYHIRKTGLPEFIRMLNTKKEKHTPQDKKSTYRESGVYDADVLRLSEIMKRDMQQEWLN